jgi:hypothetical protein
LEHLSLLVANRVERLSDLLVLAVPLTLSNSAFVVLFEDDGDSFLQLIVRAGLGLFACSFLRQFLVLLELRDFVFLLLQLELHLVVLVPDLP